MHSLLIKSYPLNKKFAALSVISIISLVMALGFLPKYANSPKDNLKETFLEDIRAVIDKGDSIKLLSDITKFSWEKVCLLLPYDKSKHTTILNFNSKLGVSLTQAEFDRIPILSESSMYSWVLIFEGRESDRLFIALKRDDFNIGGERLRLSFPQDQSGLDRCLSSDEAALKIESTVSGASELVLYRREQV